MPRAFPFLIASLALAAACSDRPTEEPVPDQQAAPETEAVQLEEMPVAFRGRWDFATEDCAGDTSEARLVLTADEAQYYESSAELTAIEQRGDRNLVVEHRFRGEGEQWNETLGYELSDDGERLSVTTAEGSLSIRMRCP